MYIHKPTNKNKNEIPHHITSKTQYQIHSLQKNKASNDDLCPVYPIIGYSHKIWKIIVFFGRSNQYVLALTPTLFGTLATDCLSTQIFINSKNSVLVAYYYKNVVLYIQSSSPTSSNLYFITLPDNLTRRCKRLSS